MMAVTLAVLGERAMIGIVVLGIEHPTRSAILRYTFPPQIGHVSGERRTLGSVTHDARFDGDAARPVRHQPRGRDAGGAATAESTAAAATSRSALQPAGFLGCCQHMRNERLGAMRAAPPPVPDAAKPDVEIIVADHGVGVGEVRVVVKLQGVVRLGRLLCAVAPRARCLMCLHSSAARPSRRLRLLSCHRTVGYPAPAASPSKVRQRPKFHEEEPDCPLWPPLG